MQWIIIWALSFSILLLFLRAVVPSRSGKAVERIIQREIHNRRSEIQANKNTAFRSYSFFKKLGIILETRFSSKANKDAITETKKLLMEAGFRESYYIYLYNFSQLAGGIVGFLFAVVFIEIFPQEGVKGWIPYLLGVALGIYIPIIYVKNRRNRRVTEVSRILPDAMEMLALCNEASMTIDIALRKIAKELEDKYPVISEQFSIVGIELSLLESRAKAFDGFYKRMPMDEVRSFVSSVNQAERTGTPIAKSLRLMASEMRKNRIAKIQAKLESLSGKLVLPLALFFLLPLVALMTIPIFSRSDLSGL